MDKKDIGLIGLSVMGGSLALNFSSKGYSLAVYNLEEDMTNKFIESAKDRDIKPTYNLCDLVNSLKSPAVIFLMIKAGAPIDQTIENLVPYLKEGDIIIDGGNSYFKDSIRRADMLIKKGIHFVGTGVSGGQEGALKGPSIMPSGSEYAKKHVEKMLMDISAKTKDNSPCCEWMGNAGAGHFVKMVHNGIEYANMQLIAEGYDILKNVLKLSNNEMAKVFSDYNESYLKSYLMEITSILLNKKDNLTDNDLVDMISDVTGQKGTGMWMIIAALELGEIIPTISEAVFMRNISALKEERIEASELYLKERYNVNIDKEKFVEELKKALYFAIICTYAQGFSLILKASSEYNFDIPIEKVALIWRGGCIIRADFLDNIYSVLSKSNKNILLSDYFKEQLSDKYSEIKNVVNTANNFDIPIAAFSSALSYFNAYISNNLPLNLTQAQRDFFGAHTYLRNDRIGIYTMEK